MSEQSKKALKYYPADDAAVPKKVGDPIPVLGKCDSEL
jgi:hypothetical protein